MISPGIIITRLTRDQLNGSRGAGYRLMMQTRIFGRARTSDSVGDVAALLMGPEGRSITGSDFLTDGDPQVRRTRSQRNAVNESATGDRAL